MKSKISLSNLKFHYEILTQLFLLISCCINLPYNSFVSICFPSMLVYLSLPFLLSYYRQQSEGKKEKERNDENRSEKEIGNNNETVVKAIARIKYFTAR